jgi:hypothetical protein
MGWPSELRGAGPVPTRTSTLGQEVQMHSDHGTVVKPNQAAIVFDEAEGFQFLMPDYGDDEQVPPGVMLLAAILLKTSDPEWVRAMIDEMDAEAS